MGFKARLVATISAALASLLLASPAAADTVIRFNSWLPATHPITAKTLKPWADEVAKVTQGRVKVEFTSGSLGKPDAQLDMVRDGIVDAALSVHGMTPTRFPLVMVGELPFLSRDSEPLSVALWQVTQKHFAARDEHQGVHLVTLFVSQPGLVWTSKRSLKDIKDWEGAKLAGGSAITLDISKLVGAVPLRAPGPQMSEMLKRGTVDGIFIDASSFIDFSLAGTVKHVLDFPKGVYAATFYVVVNNNKWNAIAPADRAAIDRISGEALARIAGRNWDIEAQKARDSLKTAGVEVTLADGPYLKSLEDKLRPLEEQWVQKARTNGVDGKAALTDLKTLVTNYRK